MVLGVVSFLGGVVDDYEHRGDSKAKPKLEAMELVEATLREHAPKTPVAPPPPLSMPSPNSRLRLSLMRERRRQLGLEGPEAATSSAEAPSAATMVQLIAQQKRQQLHELATQHLGTGAGASPRNRRGGASPGRSSR